MDTSQREVFVLSATRTAIGKYGGGLAAVPPCDLAATVVREARHRNDTGRQGAIRAAPHRGHYALVTMCIGGGQGIAAIFERVSHV